MNEEKDSLYQAASALASVSPNVDAGELIDSVKKYAMCAAVSATGIGWIRGLGATIATTLSSGFVTGMLCKLNTQLDVTLEKRETKALAVSVLQAVAPISAAALISSTGISFFPFLGRVAAMGIMSVVCYRTTMASGTVYLKAIKRILEEKGSDGDIHADDIQKAADAILKTDDIESLIQFCEEEPGS